MKMKKNPLKKNNIKAALIFYQNYEQKQKKNITKNIDSALIRSSKGFWEETSSLFLLLVFGDDGSSQEEKSAPPPPY